MRHVRRFCTIFVFILGVGAFALLFHRKAYGQTQIIAQNTVDVCSAAAPTNFLPQEKWAWEQRLCLGETADMSEYPDASGETSQDCDVTNSEHWPADRELSLNFLAWVIPRIQALNYAAHVTFPLAFSCAVFPDTFGFASIPIDSEIYINHSYFKNGINFGDDKIAYPVVIQQSKVVGTADFTGAILESDVNLYGSAFDELLFNNTSLRGLYANDTKVANDFSLNSLIASGHVLLNGSSGSFIDLGGSVIAGSIELENSKFAKINAGDMKLGGTFDADNADISQSLSLNGATISGSVFLYGNTGYYHDLDLRALTAGAQIRLDGAHFHDISAYGLQAKGGIIASDSELNSIDLGTAQIEAIADFSGTKITKAFSASSATFSAPLEMDESSDKQSKFGSIDLNSSKLEEVDIDQSDVGNLTASDATITGPLEAFDSNFHDVIMEFATIQGVVDFSGSKFLSTLDLNTANISGALNIRAYNTRPATVPTLDLTASEIGKTFDMSDSDFNNILANGTKFGLNFLADGATVSNTLALEGAYLSGSFLARQDGKNRVKITNLDISTSQVLGELDIEQANLTNVNANSATIWRGVLTTDSTIDDFTFENATSKSFVNFDGSSFKRELDLNGAYVEGLLNIRSNDRRSAPIPNMDLTAITIGGTLDFTDSKFGSIFANNAKINLNIRAYGAQVSGEMRLYGAAIGGSIFAGSNTMLPTNIAQIDLTVASIGQTLDLSDSKFQTITAAGAQIGSDVLANGTTISNSLDLGSATIGGSVYANPDDTGMTTISQLDLTSAAISRDLNINGSSFQKIEASGVRIMQSFEAIDTTISGTLNLNGGSIMDAVWLEGRNASLGDIKAEYSHFGADISLDQATFRSVDLLDTSIAGSLYADNAQITQNMSLNFVHLVGSLFLGRGKPDIPDFHACNVSAENAEIDGSFEVKDHQLQTNLLASGITIGGDLIISISKADQAKDRPFRRIDFDGAKINRDLTLQLPGYNGLANFSRASVGNELDISSYAVPWTPQAQLDLSSVATRLFVTTLDSWVVQDGLLDANIRGFSYDEIQVPDDLDSPAIIKLHSCSGFMAFAPVDCMVEWLRVDDKSYARSTGGTGFDPAIYDQLAKTLNNMGRNDDAKEVLYQKGLRQEQSATGISKYFLFLDSFTGFGQKPIRLTKLALFMLALGFAASYWSNDLCNPLEKSIFARRCKTYPRQLVRRIFVKRNENTERFALILSDTMFAGRKLFSFMFCNLFKRLVYSLDNGLPLGVTLVERHKAYEHGNSWLVQFIFLIQKALGYIIVLLAVTAVAQTLSVR